MELPTLVVFGSSPAGSAIAWKLHSRCHTVLIGSQYAPGEDIAWNGEKYQPNAVLGNDDPYTGGAPSFIVVGPSDKDQLAQYLDMANYLSSETTVVLVDSTFAVGLERGLSPLTFGVICDSDVRMVKDRAKGGKVGGPKWICGDLHFLIGYTDKQQKENDALKEYFKKLQPLECLLKESGAGCRLVPPWWNPNLGGYCWKRIVPFVTFEVVTLVYGMVDTSDPVVVPVVRGIFMELISLARRTGFSEFPDPEETSTVNSKLSSMLREFRGGSNRDPFVIHQFSLGFETYVPLALEHISDLGKEMHIPVPYTECLYSFYKRLLDVQGSGEYGWVGHKVSDKAIEEFRQRYQLQALPMSMSPYGSYGGGAVPTAGTYPKSTHIGHSLMSIHPRFEYGHSNPGSVKSALYRRSSGSSYESCEEIARSSKELYEHANVKHMMEDTTSRYGGVDTLARLKRMPAVGSRRSSDYSAFGGSAGVALTAEANDSVVGDSAGSAGSSITALVTAGSGSGAGDFYSAE